MYEGKYVFDNAEVFIRKNFKKLLPILLLTLLLTAPRSYVIANIKEFNFVLSIVLLYFLDVLIYPVLILGVCHYAMKLIRGQVVVFKDMFYFYTYRCKEALSLAMIVVAIKYIPYMFEAIEASGLISASNMRDLGFSIFSAVIAVKLVLVPFIFVERIEYDAVSIITKAWNLSTGRIWEILKIYIKLILISLLIFAFVMVVGVGLSFAFHWIILLFAGGLIFYFSIITMYSILAFAGFALNVFCEEGLIDIEKNPIEDEVFKGYEENLNTEENSGKGKKED